MRVIYEKIIFTPLTRLLGLVFLWMNLGYAPDLHAQTRKLEQDFDTLMTAGNSDPQGLWSDDITMWVSDRSDGKLYAYNLETKAQDTIKDFNTLEDAGNGRPSGLWSDDITMWVADGSDGKLYAYTLATKARDEDNDFVLDVKNTFPTSIWSDDITMWVSDGYDEKLYAYNLETKARDTDKDFALATGNDNPYGLWSDGTTMWVSDGRGQKLYAYNLETKARDADKDFNTLGVAGNTEPRGLWSDGITIWVADRFNDKLYAYAYTLLKKSQTINFSPSTGVVGDELDLQATASSGLKVNYVSSISSIAEVGTGGKAGKLILKTLGTVTITASQAGNEEYAAAKTLFHNIVVRPTKDFNMLAMRNINPRGLWSDNTTMWVADQTDDKIYAYNLETMARDEGKDFDALATAGNDDPEGIWSDDITMWVADQSDAKLYAYTLATKARDADKDFVLNVENTDPRGLWSDGTTMWVADRSDRKLYAYTLATMARDAIKDFNTLEAAGNSDHNSIWSDGTTMWVSDRSDGKLYAYTLATMARDAIKDLNTLEVARNSEPTGLWSDGTTTMWVADFFDRKIYSYAFPKTPQNITFDLSANTSMLDDTLNLSAIVTASSMLEVSYVSSAPTIVEVGTGMNAGKLIFKALGDATITASQAGNADYDAATDVFQSITVVKKTQSITFTLLSTGLVDDTLNLSATASSGLDVSYVSSNPSIAEVKAGKLILKALGDATITASQAGNADYAAATDVTQEIGVGSAQSITFTLLSTGLVDDTLSLSATASSMLDVSYESSNPSIAEVGTGMNAGKLILKAGGDATITASQAGNTNYNPATDVTQSIIVIKKTQSITFTLLSTGMVGDTLNLSATASSGLDVSYVSSNPSIAEVKAGKLILKAEGNATITASQAGNDQYDPATDVTQSITVSKNPQTITFTLSTDTSMVDDTLVLSATASSMLPVSYESSNPSIAEVKADKLILKAVGNATITASQAGDGRYFVAPEVTQDIIVIEKALSVDAENTDIRVWPNPVATQLNISSGRRTKITISLSNLTGQRLQEGEFEGKGQMDVSHLPSGVYLLYIRTIDETTTYLIYKE